MTEPKPEYNAQPDDCHAHSHDDNHGVDFWRRAPVTDAQYRRVLAERAILVEQVKELQAAARLVVDAYQNDLVSFGVWDDRIRALAALLPEPESDVKP